MNPAPRVLLASTSRYRAELLKRLFASFERVIPDVDETPLANEVSVELAMRLALAKANSVARNLHDAIVIGSDQVAELDGHVLGKPGTMSNAQAQLAACSGREVRYHTAVCVIDTRRDDHCAQAIDLTRVVFRALSASEIERYIEREQPLDCAGSFKAEGLGIALLERITGEDPTALIGLPLIALARLLRECGVALP